MMIDDKKIRSAILIAICGTLLASRPGTAQTTIYPPSGTGGAYTIAVIADGYAANEAWKFDRAVNGLVLNGLMADPFYKGLGSAFTIKKIFKPVASPQQSQFGINPNYDVNKCYIDYDPVQTTLLIESAVSSISPDRVVVIGNYEGVSLGCTANTWTYVSAGAREVGGVLEHEFGHLIAGLLDEFELPQDAPDYPGPDVDGPNCSNVFVGGQPSPIWSKATTWPKPPTNPSGCRYFPRNIVRPYDACRMRSDESPFCYVCAAEMTAELSLSVLAKHTRVIEQPRVLQAGFVQQALPAAPERSLRLLVQITKPQTDSTTGAKATVVALADVSAPVVHRYRRVGDYVYGVTDGQNVLEAGVLPGDPFQQRGYGGVSAPHPSQSGGTSAIVVVLVPGVSRSQLSSHAIAIKFFRLEPLFGNRPDGTRESVGPQDITRFLAQNRPYLADIKTEELMKAANSLP